MTLAARMGRVAPSPTLKVAAEADRLRRAGIDVVDLGAGEPDFATPGHVSAAAHAAIDAGSPSTRRRPAPPTCARRSVTATARTTAWPSRRPR